jgi:hypothetical protein
MDEKGEGEGREGKEGRGERGEGEGREGRGKRRERERRITCHQKLPRVYLGSSPKFPELR